MFGKHVHMHMKKFVASPLIWSYFKYKMAALNKHVALAAILVILRRRRPRCRIRKALKSKKRLWIRPTNLDLRCPGKFCTAPAAKNDWEKIYDDFLQFWNIPQCIGAIDGKQVAMRKPAFSRSLWHNYKGFFSMVLLAICNMRCRVLFQFCRCWRIWQQQLQWRAEQFPNGETV